MEKAKRRRLTKEEMEERLDQVYDLRLRGLSFSVIGKMLDPPIDKSSVCRDLQRLRKRFKMKEKKMTARFDYETNQLYMFEIIDEAGVMAGTLHFPKDEEIPDKIIISLKPWERCERGKP